MQKSFTQKLKTQDINDTEGAFSITCPLCRSDKERVYGRYYEILRMENQHES